MEFFIDLGWRTLQTRFHFLPGLQQPESEPFSYDSRMLESTSDDAFWVASSNNSYTPSQNVLNGHMISNKKLSLTAEYLQAVLTIPVVFLVLGLVSGILTSFGLICRCCCKCCKCLPKEKGETHEERLHAFKTQKRSWTILFYVLVLLTLISNFLCYYGYDYIDQGVNKFYDAMTLLSNIVSKVSNAAKTMNNPDASSMQNGMSQATTSCCSSILNPQEKYACAFKLFPEINQQLPLFTSATEAIASAVSPFEKSLGQFIDLTKQYLFDYRKIFIFVIFAVALIDVVILVIAQLCQSRKVMKFGIFIGLWFYFLMVILCCPFMIFTSLFADLCYPNPSQNLARQVTGGTRELLVFYSTCRGEDSVRQNFIKASTAFETIKVQVATLEGMCPGDSNIGTFTLAVSDIKTQLGIMRDQVSCPALKEVILTFLNDSFCGGIYSGIYSIWISQLITSFFLLMLIITSSVLYQYFGDAQKIAAGDHDLGSGELVHAHTVHAADEETNKGIEAAVAYDLTHDPDEFNAQVELIKVGHNDAADERNPDHESQELK